jgi:urea carboxylase
MKMEFHVAAPHDGVVGTFHCKPGMMINAGDPLVSLE